MSVIADDENVADQNTIAEGMGFRVKHDATRLSLQLRDSLISLMSDENVESDYSAPVGGSLMEAGGWLVFGAFIWIGLIAIQ